MATPLWQYDPRSNRYRNLRTGRFIGPAELRELRDAFADALARESDRLAERLVNREISLAQWVTQMRTLVKDSFIAQYAAQVGGLANMTQADYGRIGAMLAGRGERGQYWYLQRFAGEIADGSLTPAQIAARAQMYMGASVQAAEQGRASLLGLRLPAYPGDGTTRCLTNCRCSWRIDDGGLVWYATWVLGMAEHCADCLTRAKTWAPLVISKRAVM